MKILPRLVGTTVAGRLRVMPAVVVTGARQTGKSTRTETLVPGARRYGSPADLDGDRFERKYLPAAMAPDVLAANDRTIEERLAAPQAATIETDPYCLSALKHYRSLMPLAQQARKPMFLLKPADGAIGGHGQAVRDCYSDFEALARALAQRVGVPMP